MSSSLGHTHKSPNAESAAWASVSLLDFSRSPAATAFAVFSLRAASINYGDSFRFKFFPISRFYSFFIYSQILTCTQRERERHVGTPQDPPKLRPPGLLSDPPTHMPLCTTPLPSNATEIHCPKNTAGVKGIPNFGVTPVCPKEARHVCLGLSEDGDRV